MLLGFDAISRDWPESTVCIGVFDGMHLGHRVIVQSTIDRARSDGRPSIAITFDRHPLAVLSPSTCPQNISTLDTNLEILEELGVDVVVVATFDVDFSRMPAEHFFQNVLIDKLHTREVVVGHDFGFGYKRKGTAEWLSERVLTHVLPAFERDGVRVSSSRIRELVAAGRITEAASLLGRNFSLEGVVVRGKRLGTELGVPTANLVPTINQVQPAPGIYAGRCSLRGANYAAAISVGYRPAVPGAGFAIEAHLLDFVGNDLYGQVISLEFVERLRDELSFDSMTALKKQMSVDIESARSVLVKHG